MKNSLRMSLKVRIIQLIPIIKKTGWIERTDQLAFGFIIYLKSVLGSNHYPLHPQSIRWQ